MRTWWLNGVTAGEGSIARAMRPWASCERSSKISGTSGCALSNAKSSETRGGIVSDADAIVREIKIEASPETLYSFLTDPEKMTRWMGIEAWSEPRPGGTYRVRIAPAWYASGEYVEVVPNERIVYTWGWEQESAGLPPGSTTVV